MIDKTKLAACAKNILTDIEIPELPNHYRGKVRDNYDLADGSRIIIVSDRVSAFDVNLGAIPCKGEVLTQIARFWFEETRDICANHVLQYPDPNVAICKKLHMLPIEIVVRSYLAGTTSTAILTMYKKGQRDIYGHKFPDGMHDNQKLDKPIITPTTKGDLGAHDDPLTEQEIVTRGLLSVKVWEEVRAKALALFARGQDIAKQRGLILADTKYEFGLDEQGAIVLADEIHTPDSSRYWVESSYQERFEARASPDQLDKDFIRSWVMAHCDPYKDPIPEIPQNVILEAAAIYISICEQMTGRPFGWSGLEGLILERIRANLIKYF